MRYIAAAAEAKALLGEGFVYYIIHIMPFGDSYVGAYRY